MSALRPSAPARIPCRETARALRATVLLVLAACGDSGSSPETKHAAVPANGPARERPNVLLVTLDTTRWDLFAATGAERSCAPSLDAFARECLVFPEAITPAPMTQPAHTSILTGLYPFAHGVHENGPFRLGAEHTTLAEVLADAGYHTSAVLAATVLGRGTGLDQGFESYDEVGFVKARNLAKEVERHADEVTDRALARIEQVGAEPWFLWLHYFDAHFPYQAPGSPPTDDPITAYRAEVRYLDRELGRLLDHLRERGILEHTVVLITADHGEGLSLGTETTHGLLLEDHTTRVALFLRVPDASVRGRVSARVSTVDVFPTLGHLVDPDLALDGLEIHGQDLIETARRSLADPSGDFARTVYFEAQHSYFTLRWAPLTGFLFENSRYVRGMDARLEVRDPANGVDHRIEDPAALAEAERRFQELTQGADLSSSAARTAISPAEVARLATLGYLASTEASSDTPDPSTLPDPRDCYPDFQAYDEALWLGAAGRYAEALQRMQIVVEHHPDNPWFRDRLGRTQLGAGRIEEGMQSLREALERMPDLLNSWYFLGFAHLRRGELEDAERCFLRTLELHSEHYDARAQLREVHRRQGREGDVLLDTLELLVLVLGFDAKEAGDEPAELEKRLERSGRAVARLPDAEAWFERARAIANTLEPPVRERVLPLLGKR